MLHWLILFPYYFFGALCLLPALVILCRITRLKVEIHNLVGFAIFASTVGLVVTLLSQHVSINDLGARPMLILAGISFGLSLVDVLLSRLLPLPLDEQLRAL